MKFPLHIYCAGPMTGYENSNHEAFDREAAVLRSRGHTVVTPVEISRDNGWHNKCVSPEEFARADIDIVFKVDALYMLNGWEKSVGARAEHALAVWLGKSIYYESNLEA
jgi:hypothetical protein